MRADFPVLIDACVLANQGVCDLLLCLAEKPRMFVPRWSAQLLEEVERTHRTKLHWPEHLIQLFQTNIRGSFPEAAVIGYEPLVPASEFLDDLAV